MTDEDIRAHKRLAKRCFEVLTESFNDSIDSEYVLPSLISIPCGTQSKWMRLKLEISPLKPFNTNIDGKYPEFEPPEGKEDNTSESEEGDLR